MIIESRAISWVAVSTKAQAEDEKNSLPVQEQNNIAAAEQFGWQIVDTLRVPGHSRRYIDIHECARDMLVAGIDAFQRLLQHWDDCDFDVLIVRDGSRFARTQSLHAYIVERTIQIGARIYSLADGWIDETNYRMWISMAGYAAAGEIDNLSKRREMGFEARLKRGLPANHNVPFSHRLIRDEKSGKALRIEVNEDRREELDDLITLLLEGIPWTHIARLMHERYGHSNPLNEAHHYGHYRRLIYSPVFWGNTSRHYKHQKRGEWIYREGAPVPPGVKIYYGACPPAYTGEMASRIQAELERRWRISGGRARPDHTKQFSGLLICGECSYNLLYAKSKGWEAYRCMTAYVRKIGVDDCSQRKHISVKKIKAYVDERLNNMLEKHDPLAFLPDDKSEKTQDYETRIASLQEEVESLEKQLRRIILDKSATDDEMIRALYDEEIEKLSSRLKSRQNRLHDLQADAPMESAHQRNRVYQDIQALTLDAFWEQNETRINQALHRLMGQKRFVVIEGKIIGVADAPVHKKRFSGL